VLQYQETFDLLFGVIDGESSLMLNPSCRLPSLNLSFILIEFDQITSNLII
jgi:hypothetical protein